jgi:hypothetical protein
MMVSYTEMNSQLPLRLSPISASCLETPPADLQENPEDYASDIGKNIVNGKAAGPVVFSRDVGACEPAKKVYSCPAEASWSWYGGCSEGRLDEQDIYAKCNVPLPLEPTMKADITYDSTAAVQQVKACTAGLEKFPACANVTELGRSVWNGEGPNPECPFAVQESADSASYSATDVSTCQGDGPSFFDVGLAAYRADRKVPLGVDIDGKETRSTRTTFVDPGECVSHRKMSGHGVRVACASGVSYASARECCESKGGTCEVVKVAEANLGTEKGSSIAAAALRRAADTIQTAYPGAAIADSCDGAQENCAAVKASLSADGKVTLGAEVRVPLRLLSFVNSGISKIDYQDERVLERTFLER